MLHYDKIDLLNRLTKLNRSKRVSFAAACATRLFPLFKRYATKFAPEYSEILERALKEIWVAVIRNVWNHEIINYDFLNKIIAIIPPDDEIVEWTSLHGYAADAIDSIAYTIRALISNSPIDAVWAAERAYNAVDFSAQQRMVDFNPGNKNSEIKLLSDPLIQRELQLQKQDLEDLETYYFTDFTFRKIKDRSFLNPIEINI